jgi:hypothetical protein
MGLEIYFSHNAGGAGIWDLGTYNGSGATTFAIGGTVTSGHFLAGLGNTTIDSGVTKLGYLSAERTSASRFDMYYLNAATPTLTNVGTDTTLITDARTVLQYYVFALTVTGGGLVANSGNTLGMVSFTTGLSAADSQTLGTATQTLRTALGCGV